MTCGCENRTTGCMICDTRRISGSVITARIKCSRLTFLNRLNTLKLWGIVRLNTLLGGRLGSVLEVEIRRQYLMPSRVGDWNDRRVFCLSEK